MGQRQTRNIPFLPDRNYDRDEIYQRLQFHGLVDYHLARSLTGKCFWSSMILGFIIILVSGMKASISEYITKPMETTISITPTVGLRFPEVYICPTNYIHYERAFCVLREIQDDLQSYVDLQNFPEGMKFMNHTTRTYHNTMIKRGWSWARSFKKLLKPIVKSRVTAPTRTCSEDLAGLKTKNVSVTELKEMLLMVSFYAQEMIPHCEFQGQPLNCSEITKVVLDKEERVCYSIKVNKSQTVKGSGLRAFVDLQTDKSSGALANGVVVRVGTSIDPIDLGGTLAGPGSVVRLAMELRKQYLINLPLSKSPQRCLSLSHSEVPFFEIFEKPYSKPKCIFDCFFRVVLKKSQCLPIIDPDVVQDSFKHSKACTKSQMGECVQYLANKSSLANSCLSKCHLPCEMTKINVAASSMNLGQLLIKGSDVGKSSVLLDIVFSEMEYTSVRQSHATTLIELISDLGGQTGLWLGASMFSFIQLVVLFMAWCYKHLFFNIFRARTGSYDLRAKAPSRIYDINV